MSGEGKGERADKSIVVRPSTYARLRAHEAYEAEPFWRIISRLLDEHDAQSPPPQPGSSAVPAAPVRGAFARVGRAILGRDDDPPRDQGSQAVPA